jgi:hypothetical protein
MTRSAIFILLAAVGGVAALNAAPAIKEAVSAPKGDKPEADKPQSDKPNTDLAKPLRQSPASPTKPKILLPTSKVTPMKDRVAVLGFLNKRNGISRDITLKPGEAVRLGDVVIRLRACETTEDWEYERLTGAFVQVLVNDPDKKWRKYFSGWLFKESPSLNVVEHPIYDVWPKQCQMRHPDTGPETKVVRGGDEPREKGASDDVE